MIPSRGKTPTTFYKRTFPMARLLIAAVLLFGLAAQVEAADLSLKRVMLSSGGVGYFEYAADVDGDAVLGLDVPLGQVDDILKSLVVFDPNGGVAGVELPGRDDTVQAFGDAPLTPETLQSPVAYLNALHGTEVTVAGPRPMTGRIVSAEEVNETIDTGNTRRTRVTILGDDGLRQFVLEDAETIQVTDPELRDRIKHALEASRREASGSARHLTIRVKGNGARTVAVGYVAGAPLWKATYRLMLPAGVSSTARLQGWATLENQSGADWKAVTLTLQYGNPVTFRQALYRSYFVQRPEVPVEILGHVLPDIDTRSRGVPEAPPMRALGQAFAAPPPAPAPVMTMAPPADAARTEENAEETTFTLADPVDLAAGHTANVPILDREVPATRVGLVPWQAPHPLASLRVRNNDSRGLPAGVLTLFDAADAASFAGDARLGGLPAGETRLLSFAQDLRTDIETTETGQPDAIMLFSVADGVLSYTVRKRSVIRITVTAPAQAARDLLLEIPKWNADESLTLKDGKATIAEQTSTAFRLAMSPDAGETRTVTVWRDQPLQQVVSLVGGPDTIIQTIIAANNLDPTGRAALGHVLDLRRDEARKKAAVEQQRKQLTDVQDDEDRIRKNLGAVTSADPLRARLTKALDADETRIEQTRKAIEDAQTEADKAHHTLADAVTALRI
jgi:hypothetical protein